nr:MAG TPA: hypothetical protein [Caudoviricetes sp.]
MHIKIVYWDRPKNSRGVKSLHLKDREPQNGSRKAPVFAYGE